MKNCETLFEAQTSSRFKETIQPPPTHPHQIKPYYVFGTKIFLRRYTETQRQECGSWVSRNGAVQIFFLTLSKNIFAGKFAKSEKILSSRKSEN